MNFVKEKTMQKKFFTLMILILLTGLFIFHCSKKNPSETSGGDSSSAQAPVSEEGKKFLGKWKAVLEEAPGKDQIWTFKKDGTFVWEFSGMTYDGNFGLKNKTLTIVFPAQTTIYQVIEQTENKVKLTTVVNGKKYNTILTKI